PTFEGIPITVRSDAGFDLRLESLERRRDGIQLLSVRQDGETMHANLLVPVDKMVNLLSLVTSYEKEIDLRSGKPKNKNLIESIAEIRLTAVRSLWTDAAPFPANGSHWWEVWLRGPASVSTDDNTWGRFRALAGDLKIETSSRHVRFPERIVTLMS